MTDEEIIEVVSALKVNDKTMKDNGISDNLWGKAVECITFLQFENAALHERLNKAVELPCAKVVKTKEWIDRVEVGDIMWEWAVIYIDRQGEFVVEPCRSKIAADARLRELQGEKQ